MSAAVCGSKRSFFEDHPATTLASSSSSPVSKKLRCSSPIRFSPFSLSPSTPPPLHPNLVDSLGDIFPDMDRQLLERALEECGNDIDSAIKRLHELRLGSTEEIIGGTGVGSNVNMQKDAVIPNEHVGASENPTAQGDLHAEGAEWVELFVREMMSATSVDDAKSRATGALEVLEKSICSRAGAEVMQSFQKENMTLKEQVEVLIRENTILKRAVAIQHERQKEYDQRSQELQHLKQAVAQYQEQLRTLEVNNYALSMHLKQAQQSNSIPGRFHPDVF